MFEAEQYASVRRPLVLAETLPSHCYTSPEFFRRETEIIFSKSWHFVGRVDEIAEPGQFMVFDTVVGSALICRDEQANLNAFLNSCRHRGTRLKQQDGRCANIVCPYHSWTYSLNGTLRAAPGMEGVKDFSEADYGLRQVRLEEWGGFIFVNFCQDAPSLSAWLGNLNTIMSGHQPDQLQCLRRIEFEINANWKFLIENALEAYHTGTVHRSTLGAQKSESIEAEGQWDALFVKSDPDKSISTLPGATQALPFMPSLDKKSREGTWFSVIYPCTQIVFSPDCVWWLDIKPIAVDRSTLTVGACFPKATINMPNFERLAESYYDRWLSATPEDNKIAEEQQHGHQSGFITQGRYALSEHCVHRLDNWVLDRVLAKK
jgi:phenylpropionate dioxygenase-like ring-hydroxylating dioxygenase large terminal subunit